MRATVRCVRLYAQWVVCRNRMRRSPDTWVTRGSEAQVAMEMCVTSADSSQSRAAEMA